MGADTSPATLTDAIVPDAATIKRWVSEARQATSLEEQLWPNRVRAVALAFEAQAGELERLAGVEQQILRDVFWLMECERDGAETNGVQPSLVNLARRIEGHFGVVGAALAGEALDGAGSSAAGVDGSISASGSVRHHEPVGERQGRQPAPSSDLPDRVVVGSNGAYWRDYGTHYSMCPTSDDNDPVVPAAVYERSAGRS